MDSSKSYKNVVDDELIKNLFGSEKGSPHKLSEVKYFDLAKIKREDGEMKYDSNKLHIHEWFENLTIPHRILAVSTIFPKSKEVLDAIRNDINLVIKEGCDLESQSYRDIFHPTPNSNDDYLYNHRLEYGSSSISSYGDSKYHSINAVSSPIGYISRHMTFIDTIVSEDTVTLHEDILSNTDVFFDMLEQNK